MTYGATFNEGFTRVATQNSSNNTYIRDVIGNKTDKSFSNGGSTPSIIGHLTAAYHHIHNGAKVWPTGAGNYGASPIQLTAGAEIWLHGAKTEIIPSVGGIGVWFDIHWVIASNSSDADDYELRVYSGAALNETELGRIAFSRNAVQDRSAAYVPIQVPPSPANTRISMSLASATPGRTCDIKLYYHTYPDIT